MEATLFDTITGRWRVSLQQTAAGLWPGHGGNAVRIFPQLAALPRPRKNAAREPVAGAQESSILSKIAFASLWLLVFAIPWEDAITIAEFGTISRLIGMITVVLGLVAIVERGRIRYPSFGHFSMALFVVFAALSYLWSLYPEGTLVQMFTYIQLFVMSWLIWELASGVREQIRLMQAFVFGTFVSGTDTVYRFLSHQESDYQRYAGAGLNANDLGLIMALSIPVSYYLLIQTRGKMVWIYRLQLILAGTTIVLTASRGATLAAVVALAIVPLTHARLTARKKLAALVTISLLVTGALFLAPETSWERLSTTPNEFEHGTLTGRTLVWAAGWELFREHPILGVGANAFRITVSRVLTEPIRPDDPTPAPPAHNTFLSVLVEQGMIGFALFGFMLGVLAVSLKGMPALPRQVWFVCLAVWVVGVSGLTWEMRKPTWFLFGLVLAQCGSMAQKRTKMVLRPRFIEVPATSAAG
jgi:O-antigen ligase